jgi:hypothetical protein
MHVFVSGNEVENIQDGKMEKEEEEEEEEEE